MESISRRKLLREGTQAVAAGVCIGSLSHVNGSSLLQAPLIITRNWV